VIQRNRLRSYGHVLRKDDDDCVKKWVTLEVEGARQRSRATKTRKEVVDEDVDDLHMKLSDDVDHDEWWKMIRGN